MLVALKTFICSACERLQETERKKYLLGQIITLMEDNGHPNFKMHHHTQLWKQMDARNSGKGFGVEVAGTWYWYERWLDEVKKHCRENSGQYQWILNMQKITESTLDCFENLGYNIEYWFDIVFDGSKPKRDAEANYTDVILSSRLREKQYLR